MDMDLTGLDDQTVQESNKTNIKEVTKYLFLDNVEDFYGNTYAFDTYYSQEAIFDISEYKDYKITQMKLYFYQGENFIDTEGNPVPFDENILKLNEFSSIPPNIFVKDIYVCAGYGLEDYSTEEAIIFTQNSLTYNRDKQKKYNIKEIFLRWLHNYGEERGLEIVGDTYTLNQLLSDYEIRWYRYKVGAPSADEYSGVYWESLYTFNSTSWTLIDWDSAEEAGEPLHIKFIADVTKASDRFKVIIIKKTTNSVIRSNILDFISEVNVQNNIDIDTTNALMIHCSDGTNGYYYIYKKGNELIDESQAKHCRTAYVTFQEYQDSGNLNQPSFLVNGEQKKIEASVIRWYFPINNTMLCPSVNGNKIEVRLDNDIPRWKIGNEGSERSGSIEILDNNIPKDPLKSEEDDRYRYCKISYNSDLKMIVLERIAIYDQTSSTVYNDLEVSAMQQYFIKKIYNPAFMNNTIECQIIKNGISYHGYKEIYFGQAGTSGSNYTLFVLFDNNETALNINNSSSSIFAQAHLIDRTGQEIDLYNADISEKLQFKWEWHCKENSNSNINSYFSLNEISGISFRQEIKFSPPRNSSYTINQYMNTLLILKLTLKNWGDYDLITYQTIPLRRAEIINNNWRCQSVDGASYIRYASDGSPPDYYNNPYKMYWLYNYQNKGTWEENPNLTPPQCTWNLFIPSVGEDTNRIDLYLPTLSSTGVLQPLPLYIENTPNFGVQFKRLDSLSTIVWTQPIFSYLDNYPSATLNSWDGKSMVLDESNNRIISVAIAAGKKNSDNTFSGVMLGDWSNGGDEGNEIAKQTGVYGFNHGSMTYAFKEDGTAFLGGSGRGRIIFDGNKSQIYSGAYKLNNNGVFLDLDDGVLKINRTEDYIPINFDSSDITTFKTLKQNHQLYFLPTYIQNNNGTYKPISFLQIQFNGKYDSTASRRSLTYYTKTISKTIRQKVNNESFNTAYTSSSSTYTITTKNELPNNCVEIIIETYTPTNLIDNNTEYYRIYSYGLITSSENINGAFRFNENKSFHTYVQVNQQDDFDPFLIYYKLEQPQHIISPLYDDITNEPIYDEYDNKRQAYQAESTNNGNGKYITLSTQERLYPFSIGNDSFPSRRKFKVDWNGNLYARDGYFKGTIYADSGKFKGTIEANDGNIGGWIINDYGLISKNNETKLLSKSYNGQGPGLYTEHGEFRGTIYADEGQIGGWIIKSKTLESGATTLNSETGIMTNFITVEEDSYDGYIGLFEGEDANHETTTVLGLSTWNSGNALPALSTIVESNSTVRIAGGRGTNNAGSVVLESYGTDDTKGTIQLTDSGMYVFKNRGSNILSIVFDDPDNKDDNGNSRPSIKISAENLRIDDMTLIDYLKMMGIGSGSETGGDNSGTGDDDNTGGNSGEPNEDNWEQPPEDWGSGDNSGSNSGNNNGEIDEGNWESQTPDP